MNEVNNSDNVHTSEETIRSLNERITKITLFIQDKHAEVYGFLGEMPVTIPNESSPEITINILTEYYNSLLVLIERYSIPYKVMN